MTFDYVNGIQSVTANIVAGSSPLQSIEHVTGVNDEVLHTLSYQSVFISFNSWILGHIYNGLSRQDFLMVDTNVMSTTLSRAREMRYLLPQYSGSIFGSVYHHDLGSTLSNTGYLQYRGLSPKTISLGEESLVTMLQDLFTNITISLMSSAELQYVIVSCPLIRES